jgi:hypothetical protein
MFFLRFPSLLRLRQCLEDNDVVWLPSLNVFRRRQPGGAVFSEDSKTEKRGAALCPDRDSQPRCSEIPGELPFCVVGPCGELTRRPSYELRCQIPYRTRHVVCQNLLRILA